ncbi:MAG TPA: beta-propeller fold lactonase family protein, partial [Mycobacterium sp.]|nr:beta-propeller fold lactonase family protein [Mycobacterium sp.]
MGYARYVGRVGGLAVALGIGVAVATTPGVALAGPSDPDSSNSPSPGSPSAPSGSAAGSPSSSPGTDTQSPSSSDSPKTPDASGDDEASGDDSDGAAGDEESKGSDTSETDKKSETVKDKKSGSDASTAAVTPKKPKRAVAHTPSDSDVRKGEPAADSGPAVQPKSEPMAPPTVGSVSVDVGLQSASSSASTVQDLPKVEPAPEPDVRPLSSTVLSAVGLAPSADDDAPEVPGESPLLLAGLAAFRRQTQQSLVGDEESTLKVAEPSGSLLMAAVVANSAPSVSPVVGVPDQSSGVVSVSLNAVDGEGDSLSYAVTGQPVSGTVSVSGAGVVTYTPTAVARLAAGSTSVPDFDSFTVSVSDGETSTPVSVSVPVLPAVWTNQSSSSNVTGVSPYGVAVVGTTAYVANQGANTVSVINTVTGQAVGSPIVVGSAPTGVVASLDGAYVFVSNRNSGTVSVIRTSDNKVIDINPATPTTVDAIKVGSQPEMLAINTSTITTATGEIAAGARLYVANYASNTVSVIDISNPVAPKVIDTNPATTTTVDAITVGSNPRGIAFAETVNGPRVYVVNRTGGTVSVIDAVTNKVVDANPATPTTVDAIKVGTTPQLIVVSPDGTRAYVTNYGSNSVSIIDTATNKVVDANPATPSTVDAIAVPSTPVGVGLSKDGSLLYVANGTDRISVIDTKTRAVINTIQIDTAPETNYHTLAVRADGALVVTDLADRALRVVAYQRGNTAPVAIANPTVGEPDSSTGAVTGLVNIKDWDGDPLTYTTVVAPTKGSLTYDPATGSYTYTPTAAARDAAANGGPTTDTFTIRATDTYNTSTTTANVTVPILSVGNHAPTAPEFQYFYATDPVTGEVRGRVTVSDVDGDQLSYQLLWGPYGATTFSLDSSTGVFTYIPSREMRESATLYPGYADYDTFRVTISDGTASVSPWVNLQVMPIQMAPVAYGPPEVPSADPATGRVSGSMNVYDPNGDRITFSMAGLPTRGTATVDSVTGVYTYTPFASQRSAGGLDTFVVSATDGQGSATFTVTVPVRPPELASTQTQIPLSASGPTIAVNGSRAYVVNEYYGTVSAIDTNTNTVIATSSRLVPSSEFYPANLAVSPDGTRLYVANWLQGKVVVVDPNTLTPVGEPIPVQGGADDMVLSPDGKRLYVAHDGWVQSMSVIDTDSRTVIGSIPISSDTRGMVMSPDGRTIYVADGYNNRVPVIDTNTKAVVGSIVLGTATIAPSPGGIALSPDGKWAYVTNPMDNTVAVIDTTSRTVVGTPIVLGVPLASGSQTDWPTGIAVSRDGGSVYVASGDDIMVIDAVTRAVIGAVRFPGYMSDTSASASQTIAVDSSGDILSYGGSGLVSVSLGSMAPGPSQSRMMLADSGAGEPMMLMAAAVVNSAPSVSPVVGVPDQSSGVVSVSLNAVDGEGDSLSYAVTGQP